LTDAVATSDPCWFIASAAMSFWCAAIVTGAVDWQDSVSDRSYRCHTSSHCVTVDVQQLSQVQWTDRTLSATDPTGITHHHNV